MNILAFHTLSGWLLATILTAHLVLGSGLGIVHFNAVRQSARRIASSKPVMWTIVLTAGRIAVTGAVLLLISFEGAFPLLATAIGLSFGRWIVMRPTGEAVA